MAAAQGSDYAQFQLSEMLPVSPDHWAMALPLGWAKEHN
jgi:hypothetical protein